MNADLLYDLPALRPRIPIAECRDQYAKFQRHLGIGGTNIRLIDRQ